MARVADDQIGVTVAAPVHEVGPGQAARKWEQLGCCEAHLGAFGEGAVRTPPEQVNPRGVTAVGPRDQIQSAIPLEVPKLGSELGTASTTGNPTARIDPVEPERLRVLGRLVGAAVAVNEQAS